MKDDPTLRNYKIVSVLWNDPHIMLRSALPEDDIKEIIIPTLTTGILFNSNDDFVTIIHTLERGDIDEADFTLIIKGCIIAMQEFGDIELQEIRPKGAN